MRKITYTADRVDRRFIKNATNNANFDDCKIICLVDFIQSNASSIISTTDDYLEEFKPDKKERLIKYWIRTLTVLDLFWETWKRKYLQASGNEQGSNRNPKNSIARQQ